MRRLLAPLALLAAGCGPMIFAEVDEPSLCVTLVDQNLPGTFGTTATVEHDFTFDLGANLSLLNEDALERSVRLEHFTVSSTDGTDLSGITEFSLAVVPPAGSSAPEVTLLDLQPQSQGPVTTLDGAADGGVELAPYLDGGNFTVRATASGSISPPSWVGDVRACLHVRVKVDASALTK